MVTTAKKKKFTVCDYYEMARVGILAEHDRVELIEGEIIEMSPMGSLHQALVDALNHLFVTTVGQVIVRVQGPWRLVDVTEFQPDIQLLVQRDDYYVEEQPTNQDVLLVVEVSDSSLAYDRDEKSIVYARRGVPELWIDNIPNLSLLVFRDPTDNGYRTVLELQVGDTITALRLPDFEFRVEDLLGPIA